MPDVLGSSGYVVAPLLSRDVPSRRADELCHAFDVLWTSAGYDAYMSVRVSC